MRLLFIALLLSGCSTVRPVEPLPTLQTNPRPPETAMEPCPASLATLPTDRPVETREALQTALGWAGDYHGCRAKHDYLRGWIDGQTAKEPEPVKPSFWQRLGL